MNLNHQRKVLENLQAEYQTSLDNLRRSSAEQQQSDETPVASDVPTDHGDAGAVLFERERSQAIGQDYAVLLKQVERALQKISDKTYGLCDSCGKPIPARARYCAECGKAQ